MNFLLHSRAAQLRRSHRHHLLHVRTLYDAVYALKCPRDRGLDHAVERDQHLKPLFNLKNLIVSEPSKSIPLSLITESKEALGIPFRPIDFIRKYPSVFQEYFPGNLKIHPHIKLTPDIVSLNSEENLLYQSVDYKQDIAGRLLKLLMIGRVNQIPILLLEKLKWELGLPQDYEKDIVPEFPDYFRVISGKNLGGNQKVLELVCWSDEYAVSQIEEKGSKNGKIEFSLQFSKEFEMDKKYKKWLEGWQKLPYVSPYQNAMHLAAKTDESDKWSVAVLHEVLSLFVGKKAERESLLLLGEYLGLRSTFKQAFLQHPGIFYVSSKIRTHTVVLKEAYKRGMLIKRHPLMDMRSKYIKLMNVGKDEEKAKGSQQKKTGIDVKKSEGQELEDVEGEEEENDEMHDSSDEDMHNSSDDEDDVVVDVDADDEDDDDDDEGVEAIEGENATNRGRFKSKGAKFDERSTRRSEARTYERGNEENMSKSSSRFSRINVRGGDYSSIPLRTRKESDFSRNRGNRRGPDENASQNSSRFTRRTNVRGGDSDSPLRTRKESDFSRNRTNRRGAEENAPQNSSNFSRRTNSQDGDSSSSLRTRKESDFSQNRTNGRGTEENSSRFSRRTNFQDGDSNIRRRTGKKSDFSGDGDRSKTRKTPYRRDSTT